MSKLGETLTPYEAVVWLGTPNKRLDNKTPYEMMKEKKSIRVHGVMIDDMKIVKAKKKRRS
jgi:hypothetical protein